MATCGYDAVVVHSGTPRKKTEFDDQFWPLRVTPHFQHWLPLVTAGSALLIRPGARPKLLWLREENFWEQPPEVPGHYWQGSFEIVQLATQREMRPLIPRGRVAFIGEDRDVAIRLE